MCISASILGYNAAKKQRNEARLASAAQMQAQKNAQRRAEALAESSERIADAEEAKEEVAAETGDELDRRHRMRRRGVASTFLDEGDDPLGVKDTPLGA